MITCYLHDGEVCNEGKSVKDLGNLCFSLKSNLNLLNSIPIEAMILMLSEYGRRLSLNKGLLKIEGVPFLSFFLKKGNIEKLIETSLKDKKFLNEFIEIGNGKLIKAQGRGITCHWVAGNIPTLAVYSIFQALIAQNSNIVRVPKQSIELVLELLKLMEDIEISYESNVYSSKNMLKNITLIYFDSNDKLMNESMSILADARVIWGGEEAVKAINLLPKKTTCKDIVFGPKYSFAVFDKNIIESDECESYMDKLVMDISMFGQKACSSPQLLFIERSNVPLKKVAEKLASSFEKLGRRYLNILDESTASEIINRRGIYALSIDKDLYCSKGLSYTILVNNEIVLEEPIGGRCLFLKEIDSIFEVKDLITKRTQTIGIASKDRDKILKFADIVTSLGVDRIVNLGLMNIYDFPWDGCFIISELIRWCSVNIA
ncbi:acyl-CoA reductase [Clostridium sp. PL3]|uniref:Acyl-CoA reductase n=1 Tax=Clostridium thailandense TaxID=2794346 RepID=A0A949TZC4_9CLOT|nr:acyl-CoA reductase [Clostridium thailandense]MBV7273344.1 acyl-CoA reductase [Clostridium thailandense]